MNAKITLSIDIKDVPQEVNGILIKAEEQLHHLRNLTNDIVDEKSELNKLLLIEELRKKLSLLDARYEDCYTVLVGYLKVTTEEHLQKLSSTSTAKEKNDKPQNG